MFDRLEGNLAENVYGMSAFDAQYNGPIELWGKGLHRSEVIQPSYGFPAIPQGA